MQTRRDLHQAYKLMTQRLGTALLQGEPDLPESPMRRHNIAMFGGVLVAVLVAATFGVIGLLRPGNATALTDPGTVIVEEETGATFVYSAPQAKMIPVVNMASARLLVGEQEVKVRVVSAASLSRYARGTLVGIPGAPESPPAPDRLVRSPWSACVVEGVDANGERRPYTSLVGGFNVGGGQIGQDKAMLVEENGQAWLLWSNQRMRISAEGVRALTEERPRQVPLAWLNALPAGPDFRGPSVPGLGRETRGPDGGKSTVGRVFTVPPVAGGSAKWYVLLSDGLAPLTPAQAALLLQNPATKKAYGRSPVKAVELDPATATGARRSATRMGGGDLPQTMPQIVTPPPAHPVCAVYPETERGSSKALLTVGSTVAIPAPPQGWFNQDVVDQVVLPYGKGALIGLLPGNGRLDALQSLYLVGDQGRRHVIPSQEALSSLGYTMQDVAPLPAHLVHLIPEGSALDPAAARKPAQTGQTLRPQQQ
ncbi:type VII secretion protein EccB [Streptosporangium carneum]|uniref:Type VII secretion protein EccB n=1 Tax=Streptosporangium carneum TaxID=47481 RepID=A0A9W6I9G9_9ACTN|nr:type VII secretion protein EccB [Streptosporangium carneum]GLK13604.1 type VII secretion protein EccB [Streptosporangium carneum]